MYAEPSVIEEWQQIPGFEKYWVSDSSLVYSTHGKGRLRKQRVGNHGYMIVDLRADGKYHTRLVHRLVALAFIGKCPDGMEVRHLDGNRLNNSADNITYGTSSENKLDTVKHGTHNETRKTACPKGHKYVRIDSEGARRCGEC